MAQPARTSRKFPTQAQPAGTSCEFPTIPKANRRSGVGLKRIRKAVRTGELPAYDVGGRWLRLYWPEFVTWVKTTLVHPNGAQRS